MASICNDERAPFGVVSGHERKTLTLSPDRHGVLLWPRGIGPTSGKLLPVGAANGRGGGFTHDTAVLLGVQGESRYDGRAEVERPLFPNLGTGQSNAVFLVTAVPAAPAGSRP